MNPTVHLETSVISYLTARPSRDIIVAAHQQITQAWWQEYRSSYDLYVSQIVIQEASGGDSQASQRRIKILEALPLLDITDDTTNLARTLIEIIPLPKRAGIDALHMAIAAISDMNFLMTWNCKHIANATLRPKIESVCSALGWKAPIMCTPEELMGEL